MTTAAHRTLLTLSLLIVLCSAACNRGSTPQSTTPASSVRPSILLVTLDTTRADAIGPDAPGADTPAFNALAARGRRFRQAYATVPETLPSHSSMMTGLYPAGHGVHENARFLAPQHAVLAERLQQSGYRTSAFVSSFVLARRFGLARGFGVYDDELPPGRAERSAKETTDRALADLAQPSTQPRFLWVHYFEPHAPYEPSEPFRSTFASKPYLGEVAAMDRELGRLIEVFERTAGQSNSAIVVASDHGEGLGDRGEQQHGNLLYQSTMHVPLVIAGPGVSLGTGDAPVSTRRVFHTVLDWAGLGADHSLRSDAASEVVLGEAMKPFLEYGWQPQIMAVEGTQKAIFARTTEVFDLASDPGEMKNLGSGANMPAGMRKALDDYPVPSPDAARAPDALSPNLSEEAKRSLASLGYVSASAAPIVRKDAPRPVDMTRLFEVMDHASSLFVAGKYAEVIPVLQKIRAEDPYNLDAALRLATAHSALGHDAEAIAAFKQAAAIGPRSPDVRMYLALHYARGKEWERAAPILEQVVAESPNRLPALQGLASIREKQGRLADAIALRQKAHALETPTAVDLIHIGELAMAVQQTPLAIESFEKARAMEGPKFQHDVELGVLYLAARRLTDARDALDRVPSSHPGYAMALFKRAQVSVLLKEPDSNSRIALARKHADRTTKGLIEAERLFK